MTNGLVDLVLLLFLCRNFTREGNCDLLQPCASLGSQSEVNTWPIFDFSGLLGMERIMPVFLKWFEGLDDSEVGNCEIDDWPRFWGAWLNHTFAFPPFSIMFSCGFHRNLHIIHPLSATWYPGKIASGVNVYRKGVAGQAREWVRGEIWVKVDARSSQIILGLNMW